ncbi:hypothetical protein SERLA73DRAFT_190825 [Serpula lacrymans var. lacrymans S7.3]|uniref:Thioredoxin-like fold domain-containing protein n=2 Tax=Serpula lacrymans var. lacrymans TaxID=341189 RepID=F8QGG3_SERL3|nr:uncharacterized protein SERLADRAFT_459473 [Serpula lacrymans var. lacrymans S7.9]EGN92641.1 hypothetical protein SERLA73DRAFT_190825 [Serpula lacrymans var. lacrymans S7.3]EGO28733.1 hypothetical protein SERLADRAFT_459473 [Serpula lacrymans var. lacrymans S7.9]
MFSAFKRSLPQVSIFHNPSSPPSVKALSVLRSSLSLPYPSTKPSSPPLQFDLEVVESAPTADQLSIILSYLPSSKSSSPPPALSAFFSSHPTAPSPSERPQSADGLVRLVSQNPSAFRWPVVVDWTGGRASIGDVEGVGRILEAIRQRRDGEVEDEAGHQPKGWFS